MRQTSLLRSSTFRLALIYMALFSLSNFILLGFIYWSTASYMARQTDATIEAEITGLAERYKIRRLPGLTDLIRERLARKPAGSAIYLLTDARYNPIVGNLLHWPTVGPSIDGWVNFRLEYQGWRGHELHRVRARRFLLHGRFHLLVGRDIHELERSQRLIAETLTWGLVITFVLALIGGTLTSRSMVRRIDAINQTSRDIMSGDLSRRIPTNQTGDEFDVLSGNLNRMLDQIESLMESVRRVSDNIAHDLRTPLAHLRNHLERLRSRAIAEGYDTAAVEQAIREADGLLATFSALLRIARVEADHRRERFISIDLAALVRDVVELYEPLAEEKSQRLALTLTGGIQVGGDRDLLFQAVANILDNAIKYTPSNGRIQISLDHGPTGLLQLIIADSGNGIPPEAREKVLQRFFRLESSRRTPGNGLGLSLVAAVVKLHDIKLHLEDNGPGLRVVLDFPATAQHPADLKRLESHDR